MKLIIYLAIATWPITFVGAIRLWQFTGVKLQQLRDRRQRELDSAADRWLK